MEPFSILLRDQIAVIALADGPFALAAFSTPRNRRLEISTFHRYVRPRSIARAYTATSAAKMRARVFEEHESLAYRVRV